ncbi:MULTISPECIES: PIN domain-containing protein [unclassified Burkholderia]|uniref:PIN domain-containing protein n=1 Tax=unclassified Burkholderia TaxID=2613784 RepID=UPI000F5A3DEC|nr:MULTISPECIES: PIN domain-containing protein [unclassified Burkholderia]RQS22868.1 PIN domain-containing protein [Burkholderia sp. Bp8995]RQS42871.1 PIN domain-containing protein [Burkholderia sp. Bp8989]
MTKVYVSDTNIWIDFHHAALLNELFRLPFSLCCTDFVASELDVPKLTPLVELGLIVESINESDVQQLFTLTQQHKNPSLADMSCYFLAKKSGLPLLTGDGQLRKLAKDERVEVRGALWLLDQMVEHAVIEACRAAEALRTMLQKNARLPEKECQIRLERWEM